VFAAAPRFPPSSRADAGPGPGAYEVKAAKVLAFTMRFREKFGTQTFTTGFDAPGPGSYARLTTKQTAKRNAPALTMRPRRELRTFAMSTPAPHTHQRPASAAARMALSTKPNLSSVKFGTASRFRPGTVSTSAGNIGPLEYNTTPGFAQMSTIKRGAAFSMSFRHPEAANIGSKVVPAFNNPVPAIGKQPLSTIKTMPAFTLAGRTRFGSLYG
jgi:hypothetical protein